MVCTRCDGTGFLNLDQIPDGECDLDSVDDILRWIKENDIHDVQVCDCCGNGETWYGEPGEHNLQKEMECYSYNGGLPECY